MDDGKNLKKPCSHCGTNRPRNALNSIELSNLSERMGAIVKFRETEN